MHRFSVNPRAGIVVDKLIGPVEIPSRLNAESYLIFLQNNLFDLLEGVPPGHISENVRNRLDEYFPER